MAHSVASLITRLGRLRLWGSFWIVVVCLIYRIGGGDSWLETTLVQSWWPTGAHTLRMSYLFMVSELLIAWSSCLFFSDKTYHIRVVGAQEPLPYPLLHGKVTGCLFLLFHFPSWSAA